MRRLGESSSARPNSIISRDLPKITPHLASKLGRRRVAVPTAGSAAALPLGAEATSSPTVDAYDDLYSFNAPSRSIAGGADFGRLGGLAQLGISVDVSTLERLVLAEARCHHVVFKVVAYEGETERKRLHGHSIVCPHKPEEHEHKEFGMAALEAAFALCRIIFVGPSGAREKLEAAAMKIDDLRLRPDVIANFLTIRNKLHGGTPPPSKDVVEEIFAKHGGLQQHIKKHVRCMYDTAIERATTPSDIAGNRSAAQSEAQAALADDAEAAALPPGAKLAPTMNRVGVLEFAKQETAAIIDAIEVAMCAESEGGGDEDEGGGGGGAVSDSDDDEGEGGGGEGEAGGAEGAGDGGDDGGDAAAQMPEQAELPQQRLRRDGIFNDYESGPEAIYKAWWPLFPLRRGFAEVHATAPRARPMPHALCAPLP